MEKTIKEELKHIPHTSSAQGELRTLYNIVRRKDFILDKTKEETLAHCMVKIRESYTSWQPEYDRYFFKISLSLIHNTPQRLRGSKTV